MTSNAEPQCDEMFDDLKKYHGSLNQFEEFTILPTQVKEQSDFATVWRLTISSHIIDFFMKHSTKH